MPTRVEYVQWMKSKEGEYGPPNNDNEFNTKYYRRRVSGDKYAWCAVFEWCAEDHFGIAGVNGGKVAYVPNMVATAHRAGAKVWHRPVTVSAANGFVLGNKICYDFNRTGEAEHTGTFVSRINAREFYSIEGNTSVDAVALRRRNVADVLDVIELLGVGSTSTPSAPQGDVMEYVSLSSKAPQKYKAGVEKDYTFDVVNSDKGKMSSGARSLIVQGGKNGCLYSTTIKVTGVSGTCHLVEVNDNPTWSVHKDNHGRYPVGSEFTINGLCDAGRHLWLKVKTDTDGDIDVTVTALYQRR